MLLKIRPESDTPIYLQLRDQIVAGIAAGELKPGDPLPSVREFARDLGVNYHTVNKGYALLRDEGFLNLYGRKGAVVANPPAADEAFLRDIEEKLRKMIAEAMSKGMEPGEIARIASALSEEGEKR